jgi:TonB family protein
MGITVVMASTSGGSVSSISSAVQTGSDCWRREATTIAAYERTASENPQAFLAQLALAGCYDNAWRFQDVEPALARAATVLVSEVGAWIPKPGARPVAGEDVPAPKRTRDKSAGYPERALINGVRGLVILELLINPKGEVKEVRAVQALPDLAEAARKAARDWKFEPTMIAGKPVEVLGYAAVRFGQTTNPIPADFLEMAAFYYQRGLFRLVRAALESALAKSREDRDRFGTWVHMNSRPGGAFTNPVKTKHVPPKYPEAALAGRTQGSVTIETLVDIRGNIGRVHIVSPPSVLDAAAVQAVLQWQFTPATRDSVPTAIAMMILVDFRVR